MPSIRQSQSNDLPDIKTLLNSCYGRPNEANFFGAIQQSNTYIPELSLVASENRKIIGYILLTRIGIRTANEIMPTLVVLPFTVKREFRGEGVGKLLVDAAIVKARDLGFTSCTSLSCGKYFRRFGFLPARDEFGLELYFKMNDTDFLALELTENALYRKSGFLIFPGIFSKIDPVYTS